MQIIITPRGEVRCIYAEAIDLATLGTPTIARASHVEPNQQGDWLADMSPVGGASLGPFRHRSEALAAEHAWLIEHWLVPERLATPRSHTRSDSGLACV
jgi:hypothetical protein